MLRFCCGISRASTFTVCFYLLLVLSLATTGSLLITPLLLGPEVEDLKLQPLDIPGRLTSAARTYISVLHSHPLRTKVLTATVLYSLSDCIAQAIEGAEMLSYKRTIRFSLFGGPFWTPFLHFWYNFIEEVIPQKGFKSIAVAVFVDQGFSTPLYVVVYFTADSLMKFQGLRSTTARIRSGFRKVVLTTWAFWVPAQLINFGLVPLHLRILAVNLMAIIWNVIFSMITNSVQPTKADSLPTTATSSSAAKSKTHKPLPKAVPIKQANDDERRDIEEGSNVQMEATRAVKQHHGE
ncbi:hypothetical protein NDN08_003779 [Rhodosorus marinus]|uniref:Peroxisomal membrane protein MPV17 n=1 Tax=Rhodosorus marinus TaxID=101924 RepID=A0AAV8ULQ6_9RHOD|nr:hypothetical protein NDN08_003779 [Rhodosorus marinus]